MTALTKYNHLECEGLWRGLPDEDDSDAMPQRREVVATLGDATLIISDKNEMALTHWSLSAIHRVNPKQHPAIFSPTDDSSETLELDEDIMIEAIEKITKAIVRARPKPGRIRYLTFGSIVLAIAGLAVFWLPNALVSHTLSVLPASKRLAIGSEVLGAIGNPCRTERGNSALATLSARLSGHNRPTFFVIPNLSKSAEHLPGDIILLSQDLIEKFDDPSVVSGYILAEKLRARGRDPMEHLLKNSGLLVTFKLLTTGAISSVSLNKYAAGFSDKPAADLDYLSMAAQFQELRIRATPYAYAVDPSGETTFELIESDLPTGAPMLPILKDGDWISLQGICEN